MICYTCKKFLKKGHGKNTYIYAGEYRYYCFFCLKISDFHQKINKMKDEFQWELDQEKRKYYVWLIWIDIALISIFWLLFYSILGSSSFNSPLIHIIQLFIGFIIYFLTSYLIIEPKLAKLRYQFQKFLREEKEKLWKPLEEEKRELRLMKDYVNSLRNEKERCFCEKCLLIEWNKR